MAYKFKSASSAKTGKKFKEKRIELGFSITQIAEKLFINKNYLSAIENGDYSVFPSESFARAYYKKYAKYLDINDEFPNIFGQIKERKNKKISTEIRLNNPLGKNLSYLLIFSLVIFGIIFLYFLVKNTTTYKIPIEKEVVTSKNIDLIVNSVLENKLNNDLTISKNILLLEFNDECWIELYMGEKLILTKLFNKGELYRKEIRRPFKIIIGNAEYVKGTYNDEQIDFITNANRLTKVNTIYFLNE